MKPVRWSDLKHIAQSPYHYKHKLSEPFEPTGLMKTGSLVHDMILGGSHRFVVYPKARNPAHKEYQEFMAAHEGYEILSRGEWEKAEALALALEELPCNQEAYSLLTNGNLEQRIDWNIAGRECHGTPDAIDYHENSITDLKCTQSADPRRFPWHARNQQWHGQLAWYENGLREAFGWPELGRISIVALETSSEPYVATVFDLTPRAIEAGHRLWRSCWERLMCCEKNDHWPAYVEGIAQFDVEDETLIIDGEEIDI